MAIQDRLGLKNKGGAGIRNRTGAGNINTDARNKLVQKSRQNIKDARERLGQLAKEQGDVRNKLNKGKKQQGKQNAPLPLMSNKLNFGPALYNNLSTGLKKKLLSHVQANRIANNKPKPIQRRNNVQQLVQNQRTKTAVNSGSLTRTVSTVTREKVRRLESPVKARNIIKPVDQGIRRERFGPRKEVKQVVMEEPRPLMPMREQRARVTRLPAKTVGRSSPWANTQVVREQPRIMQRRERIVPAQPEYVVVDEWDSPMQVSNGMSRKRTVYEDEDNYEYVPAAPKKPILSIASRLDEKPQMSFAQGYKILVCNLHQTVTLEDVEELFGNIGALSSVQMIGTGMAEVVFMKKEDAYKAIEVYHYRLLDGQPMNVSVVSNSAKRPPAAHLSQQRSAKMVYNTPPPSTPFYNQPVMMQSRPVTKSVLKSASGSSAHYAVNRRTSDNRGRPAMYSSGGFF